MVVETKTDPTGKLINQNMVQNHKTGGFHIPLGLADRKQMAKKNIVAMAADFQGHYCIYRGARRKITEQKERFNSPQEAIAAIK